MKQAIFVDEMTPFKTKEEEWHPYAWFEDMRKHHPVSFHEGQQVWNVFTYDHVKRVLSDHELFSSVRDRTLVAPASQNDGTSDRTNILFSDPPEHRRRRSLLSAAFTPRHLRSWEPRIQAIAEAFIDDIDPSREIDIVKSLANPFPITVIAELLGVPPEDRHLFQQWVEIIFLPFDKENMSDLNKRKAAAAQAFSDYLQPIIKEKRVHPADDIISDLINAERDGEPLTEEEIIKMTRGLLGAGLETTSHLITNCFYAFLYDSPGIYRKLREDPELVPQAIEEVLRYRFHIMKMERRVKKDTDVLGPEMKEGEMIVAWMSAANLDEQTFDHADQFDIDRPNNRKHLTFSTGPHFCLGAPLARLEVKTILTGFIKRFSNIRSIPSFDLESHLSHSIFGQSLNSLPILAER
ncbi:hypothetical protein EV207_11555 [Scopulibacillus darangshiensis]|uniref:Cytochrome P450 n=2 Tax=Scopulibacillus darangshiensis TaxID=442528 RepID=A0A4R2P272_9BACL|nr:hypothetical protein EV207_11555 [Scopulibacillus darangshiensis]